jgi:hypothetical protein
VRYRKSSETEEITKKRLRDKHIRDKNRNDMERVRQVDSKERIEWQ